MRTKNAVSRIAMRLVTGLVVGVLILGVGLMTRAEASSSGDIDLHVTIASDLQISLSSGISITQNATNYAFGALTVNVTTITNVAVASNTSSANIETFGAGLTNPGVWTAASTNTAADTYNLRVVFTTNSLTTTPADSEFASNDDVASGAPVKATGTLFAPTTGSNGNGVSVPNTGGGAERNRRIWVRLVTPAATSTGLEQVIKLTVNAQLP